MDKPQNIFINSIAIALSGDKTLYKSPRDLLYQSEDVKPYNLDIPLVPAVVCYPKTTEQVAAIVRCAVQAGLGGIDGAVVIDLKHFQKFSMNRTTWEATIGAGTLLGDLTQRMHDNGGRAMAHGTCPTVGIGGHITIGGLGPSSRLWGTALDHIQEVEVVLADSSIVRASKTQNTDLFWAIRGAGASFGVVTEFLCTTEPEPGTAIAFSYSFEAGTHSSLAMTFKAWQEFVSDPGLDRRFASELIITQVGLIISGTYYGTEEEFDAYALTERFPGAIEKKRIVFKDWLGLVGHWAETVALRYGGQISGPLYTKSLTFNGAHLITPTTIDKLFDFIDKTDHGTLVWFIIFDLAGGKVNDVPQDATAYAHRDALFYLQSYAIGWPKVSVATKDFLRGVNKIMVDHMPNSDDFGCYAGYVDPELKNGPKEYWRMNLPKLIKVKNDIDSGDVFHNPQSVPLCEEPSKEVVVPKAAKRSSWVVVQIEAVLGCFVRFFKK